MRIELTTEDRERFEKYVDRSGGPDACHPWMGFLLRGESGRFSVGGRSGRMEYVHRVAWCLAGNEITPQKPFILHNCPGGDLSYCCNERHLWAGTQDDNVLDMARKGRGRKSKRGLPFGAFRRENGRFSSYLRVNGKTVHLGTFDTAERASAVSLAEKARRYGISINSLRPQGDDG